MKLQGQVTGKADSKKDEIASRSAFSIGDYIGRLDPATGKVAEWPPLRNCFTYGAGTFVL